MRSTIGLQVRAHHLRAVVGAATVSLAVTVLVGWAIESPRLIRPVGGTATMKANTALCLALVGAAVIAKGHEPAARVVSRWLGLVTAVASGLTLLQYPTGWDLGVDELLLSDHLTTNAARGRMSVPAAAGLFLLGAALAIGGTRLRSRRLSPWLAIGTGVLSATALVGYLFGSARLYQPIGATSIALNTAVILLALSLAVLSLDPPPSIRELLRSQSQSGMLIRWTLPSLSVATIVSGWLSVRGQRAGWYDANLAIAVMVMTSLLLLCVVLGATAVRLQRARVAQLSAETAAATATSDLAAILDASPTAIYVKDLDGRYLLANQRFIEVFAPVDRDIIGRMDVDVFTSEVADGRRAADDAVVAAAVPREATELVASPDGDRTYVSVRFPLIGDDGVRAVCGISTDVTEQTRIIQRERELEVRLASSQRLESVGMLAGGIAHDFNNILAAILNYATFVSEAIREHMLHTSQADRDTLESIARDSDEIVTAAERAAALTRQLLIFSRRDVSNPEVLDINGIITDIKNLLRRTIGENIDLETVLAGDLPLTRVDRGQIEQVVVNLVINARDALTNGGCIKVETRRFEVDHDYAAEHGVAAGSYARLTVSDTGPGMTPEIVARAFEPFFTTKPKGQGTGLGLSTVYGIATQSGGDVVISSEPGIGTIVGVNFPATQEQPTLPTSKPAAPTGRGETVLLVEDEEIVREPARRILSLHGYDVLVASGPDEALRVAVEHPGIIHLLLTDVVMPSRSGKELSIELRCTRPATKVLYMSGYNHDIIAHDGVIEAGVALLEKPFTPDSLLQAVRNALLADGDASNRQH